MSNVYIIGDTHFGHQGITKFRKQFPTELAHRHYIKTQWNKVITKNDVVYVLGDAAFTLEGLRTFGEMNGRKILVAGNHDTLTAKDYLMYFEDVQGAIAYKGAILTHIPIHPTELYRWRNLHGHCHRGGPDGEFYFNACLDFLPDFQPIKFVTALNVLKDRAVRNYTRAAIKQMEKDLEETR